MKLSLARLKLIAQHHVTPSLVICPHVLLFTRIHKYASCSTECFILALVYIDRLIQRNNFLLTHLNVHRVVITSILLAAKFFDDAYYNNAYYAKVGGVLVSEMNSLEVEFLFRVNFELHVSPEVYNKYHAELVSHALGTIEAEAQTPKAFGLVSESFFPSVAESAGWRPPIHSTVTPAGPVMAVPNNLPQVCEDIPSSSGATHHITAKQSDGQMTFATNLSHYPQDHRRISPSPNASPTHVYYHANQPGHQAAPSSLAPLHMMQPHQRDPVPTGQYFAASNLAAQLHNQHFSQPPSQPSSYCPTAASSTVSLSDTDEYDHYQCHVPCNVIGGNENLIIHPHDVYHSGGNVTNGIGSVGVHGNNIGAIGSTGSIVTGVNHAHVSPHGVGFAGMGNGTGSAAVAPQYSVPQITYPVTQIT